eukprot:565874-Prorocentrum_minimum.AAC.1
MAPLVAARRDGREGEGEVPERLLRRHAGRRGLRGREAVRHQSTAAGRAEGGQEGDRLEQVEGAGKGEGARGPNPVLHEQVGRAGHPR